ncbi:MAG: NAD-dependent epimerase/dehydratase family protein [Chitinophagales bacterium]
MSRILITGGFGFVGGRLTRRLAEDHEVWVSSRRKPSDTKLRLHGNVRCIDHALLLSSETFPAFIDTVIHLAALNELDSVKFASEAIRVNIDETRIILENSIEQKVERFIYFSTAHIYGTPLHGTITEETLPFPTHPYAITHRSAEDYVVAATMQKRIWGTVLRLSNSFGAPVTSDVNRWSLLTNDLCRQAVEKGRLTLRSNGCQYRDFICLSDVEELISNMLIPAKKPEHIIYNMGSGISMRLLDMADLIIQSAVTVLQKNITLELPAGCVAAREPELLYSINRLLSEGYRVQNDLTLELERLLVFCKENFTRH